MKSTGARSSDEFQWLGVKIGYQDRGPNRDYQDDVPKSIDCDVIVSYMVLSIFVSIGSDKDFQSHIHQQWVCRELSVVVNWKQTTWNHQKGHTDFPRQYRGFYP